MKMLAASKITNRQLEWVVQENISLEGYTRRVEITYLIVNSILKLKKSTEEERGMSLKRNMHT